MTAHVRRVRLLSLALFFFPFIKEKKSLVVVEAGGECGQRAALSKPCGQPVGLTTGRHYPQPRRSQLQVLLYYI
jgi:hypothetical protein